MMCMHVRRAARLALFFGMFAGPAIAQTAESDSVSPPASGGGTLQSRALEIVESASGSWGVMAWSIDRQQTLIAINPTTPMVPASNNKIFTAIWALDELGPDHRFATDLLTTGRIENGVLRGDVIIRGSGDPAFGYPPKVEYDMFIEESMTPLRKMAQALRQLGVRSVEGDIIGDATAFDTLLVGPDWPNDTGAGAARYAPGVSGLPYQRNMIWVQARAGANGVEITREPDVTEVPVVAAVTVGGSRAIAVRNPYQDTVRVRGSIPRGSTNRFGVGVSDPALMTTGALRTALEEAGIRVGGRVRKGPTPEGADLVHRHLSIPVSRMIPLLNQHSDNFFAEHLWKAAAREATGVGGYNEGGPAAALHFIDRAGVEPGQLYQFDGSGLSRHTRVTPLAIVRALIYADMRPYSETFHRSLAVAGDRDGTMNRLYRGTDAEGNLHAKTGFIRGVRTLSGYVRSRSGELIAFSFLYNGGNTNGARAVQEDLGVLLAEYGGR